MCESPLGRAARRVRSTQRPAAGRVASGYAEGRIGGRAKQHPSTGSLCGGGRDSTTPRTRVSRAGSNAARHCHTWQAFSIAALCINAAPSMKKLAAIVLIRVSVVCSSGTGNNKRQGNAETTEEVPLAAEGAPGQTAGCSVERWAVNTGTDLGASKVDQTPVPTTVAELVSLPAPENPVARVAPTEDTTCQLSATLTEFKTEADSDYHLVLASGAKEMIAEIPSPVCVTGGPLQSGIANAQAEFDARLSSSTQHFQTVNVPVIVTGVGFFDRIRGQTGVAPNGIELHPVIDIQFP